MLINKILPAAPVYRPIRKPYSVENACNACRANADPHRQPGNQQQPTQSFQDIFERCHADGAPTIVSASEPYHDPRWFAYRVKP